MTVETQPTPSPESIDLNSSDEDLIGYVSHRKNGDPLPSNVIADVNPFFIEPLDAHGDKWYLCSFEGFEYDKGGKVRIMEGGYWKQTGNDEHIHVNSQTNGSKLFWEFFRGNEPFGDRTAWMILEYHSKYKEIQDENDKQRNAQEFNSLCRIYSGSTDEPCTEERHNDVDVNENVAIALEAKLLNIHNVGENNSKSESEKESQVADKKIPLHPIESYCGYNSDNSVNNQGYDDCNEDYVTMLDLLDDLSSPSSFENSSRYSEMPDDCFDHPALLLSIVGEGNVSIGQESSADVRTADNLRSAQVVNEPSLSEGVQGNGSDESVALEGNGNNIISPGLPVGASANLYRVQSPTSSLAMCIPSSSSSGNGSSSKASMFGKRNRKQKRALSRSSDGSGSGSSRDSGSGRSPSGSGDFPSDSRKSSSGSRIKRLGKKYCCLGSF